MFLKEKTRQAFYMANRNIQSQTLLRYCTQGGAA